MRYEQFGVDEIPFIDTNNNLTKVSGAVVRDGNFVHIEAKYTVNSGFTPSEMTKILRVNTSALYPWSGYYWANGLRVSGTSQNWDSNYKTGVCEIHATDGHLYWGGPPYSALNAGDSIWVNVDYIIM